MKCLYCNKKNPLMFIDEDGIIFCNKCKDNYKREGKNVTVIGISTKQKE